ncbi:MAG: tRNA pseudouridine(55) synthase TruB [Atopobium sp.]|uniref:tRNA pseudouridine(55) synthase TruB n=1 Tax=Atopobium sp. TaxID=1872650 RepID=UPI002A747AD8|nr:tRNA pseudouridine(55) synthase TruB [Atopobium sp.]MDY2788791.1 tRNA pseudouridine(55) synthase TruB [Atopobium sp.]
MKRSSSGLHALIAIDKPLGMTSHDIVYKLRRALHERRIGHAGTLDPDASGVLVVGVGQGTRLMGLLSAESKRYQAGICFGTQTSTDDAAGEVIATAQVPERLSDACFATQVMAQLVGEHEQVPPAYSAISINGMRAYDLARSGKKVELAARHITIHEASLVGIRSTQPLIWDVDILASKGTYIRSIARDVGLSLGTVAHICSLRRTQSGSVSIDSCAQLEDIQSLQELTEEVRKAALQQSWLNPLIALGYPVRTLQDAEMEDVRCGRKIWLGSSLQNERIAEHQHVSLLYNNKLVGVWERRGTKLVCVANFPDGIEGVQL